MFLWFLKFNLLKINFASGWFAKGSLPKALAYPVYASANTIEALADLRFATAALADAMSNVFLRTAKKVFVLTILMNVSTRMKFVTTKGIFVTTSAAFVTTLAAFVTTLAIFVTTLATFVATFIMFVTTRMVFVTTKMMFVTTRMVFVTTKMTFVENNKVNTNACIRLLKPEYLCVTSDFDEETGIRQAAFSFFIVAMDKENELMNKEIAFG